MSDLTRFPKPTATVVGPDEADQIITLANAVSGATAFPRGGPANYVSVLAWKKAFTRREVPYQKFVVEFTANQQTTIGSGTATTMIGLYGEILLGPGAGKYLLGILGIVLSGTKPQIPIFSATNGFAQIVCDVGNYDALAIGGVGGDIAAPPETTYTVRIRPIRHRSYSG